MQAGIIIPVDVGEAVDWCTRMVVVPKKDGSPRITVDFQELNTYIKRETHHTSYPFNVVNNVPIHSYKTVADAKNGYNQATLDDSSSKVTTFITEFGRYRFIRSPQGLKSAGDAYTRRFDEVIVDTPRKFKIVDDSLLYDPTIRECFYHTYDFLSVCSDNSITLEPRKFKFCRKEVDFAGYYLGWEKYTPSSSTLEAISNFPMPEKPTITGIRSWCGLVNQISPFFLSTGIMLPFASLLKHKNASSKYVYWDIFISKMHLKPQNYIYVNRLQED